MNYQLIKKENQYLLVSETEKEGNWICNSCNMPNYTDSVSEEEIEQELLSCISCGGFEFHRKEYQKILASTEPIEHTPHLSFTPEVANELGIVDVYEIANSQIKSRYGDKDAPVGSSDRSYWETQAIGFEEGYNYHKEQTKDKLYTREDMEKCWDQAIESTTGGDDFPMGGNNFKYPTKGEYISSLHINQWNVEIEMDKKHFRTVKDANGIPYDHEYTLVPKVTNNTITITKILK